MSKSAFTLVQKGCRVIAAEPVAELIALLIFLKLWRHRDDLGYMLRIKCEVFRNFGV